MEKKTRLGCLLVCLMGITAVFAQDDSYSALLQRGLRVDAAVPQKILLSNHHAKIIRLMSVTLSPPVFAALANRTWIVMHQSPEFYARKTDDLPSAINLGMNGEPVLDQGEWGTCATFAVTGAINAMLPLMGAGSISQLCYLELTKTVDGNSQGAWYGAFGFTVLGQLNQYGFIDKTYQRASGCGGLKKYPADSVDDGSAMSVVDFTAHSAMTFTGKDWIPVVSYNGHFEPINPDQANTALTAVKTALFNGYRVVFATLLDPNVGDVGASGEYNNVVNDTWVMTSQIQSDLKNQIPLDAHEIIIDGYDDNACANYQDGTTPAKQCGLLRLRNSWSAGAGDQGDFYMSYDHFKSMVIEAYKMGKNVRN